MKPRKAIPRVSKKRRARSGVPFKTMKDGREICLKTPAGKEEYKQRTIQMYERDKCICCLCGQFIAYGYTFEHKDGRGMGGSKRDDRIEGNGVAHWLGNGRKGSMSYEAYMAIPLEERIQNCKEL